MPNFEYDTSLKCIHIFIYVCMQLETSFSLCCYGKGSTQHYDDSSHFLWLQEKSRKSDKSVKIRKCVGFVHSNVPDIFIPDSTYSARSYAPSTTSITSDWNKGQDRLSLALWWTKKWERKYMNKIIHIVFSWKKLFFLCSFFFKLAKTCKLQIIINTHPELQIILLRNSGRLL